jgi:hypothetical protein
MQCAMPRSWVLREVLVSFDFQGGILPFGPWHVLSFMVRANIMDSFHEFSDTPDPEISPEETTPADWVPDLAERLQTLEQANLALERARELLERVNRIESKRDGKPGD